MRRGIAVLLAVAVSGADPGQCLNLHTIHITQAGGFDQHIVVADPLIELPKLRLQAQQQRTRHRGQTWIVLTRWPPDLIDR